MASAMQTMMCDTKLWYFREYRCLRYQTACTSGTQLVAILLNSFNYLFIQSMSCLCFLCGVGGKNNDRRWRTMFFSTRV